MQQAQLTIKQYPYAKKIKIQHNNNNKQANTILYNYKSKWLRNIVILISRLNKSKLVFFLIRLSHLFHSVGVA